MTNIPMMSFYKDGVSSNIVTESNSVTYKLEIAGATDFSVAPYIKRNDVDITRTFVNGLNVREFNSLDDIGTIRSFALTNTDSSINNGFVTYMNSSNAELIVLFSGKNLKTSKNIEDQFKIWGSVNWPTMHLCDNYSCGYVAVYSPKLKRILHEVMLSTDGVNTDQAVISLVYDDFRDIGILGYPCSAIKDSNEYSTSTEYEYKRYPTENASNLMSDYNLIQGEPVLISADVYQSSELLDADMKTQIDIHWFTGDVLNDSVSISSDIVEWSSISNYYIPPTEADSFSIVVSRFPQNDDINALSAIKNLVFTQSTIANSKDNIATIGVNGIRASKFIEVDDPDKILSMPLDVDALDNIVSVINLQEY